MFTPVLDCSVCRRSCLAHEHAQRRNRWFNADAVKSRYRLSIEPLARHDTVCPDCRAPYDVFITDGRRDE